MCQFTPNCDTIEHRPGTVCPVAARTPRTFVHPAPSPVPRLASTTTRTPRAAAPAVVDRPSYRAPAAGGGISALDLALWVLVLSVGDPELSAGWLLAAAIAFLVPLGIGTWLTEQCGAWRNDGSRRCTQERRLPFNRCQDHKRQVVTVHDVISGLAIIIAFVNVGLFAAQLI